MTDTDSPMTQDELATWMRERGVPEGHELDLRVAEHLGKTEDEMDQMYEDHHGWMA